MIRSTRRPRRRLQFAAFALAAGLLSAGPLAAATCWDPQARTVRCDAPSALPVGSPRPATPPGADGERGVPLPARGALICMVCVLAGLFGLIVALPPFDGDWEPGPRRDPPE